MTREGLWEEGNRTLVGQLGPGVPARKTTEPSLEPVGPSHELESYDRFASKPSQARLDFFRDLPSRASRLGSARFHPYWDLRTDGLGHVW